MYDSIVVVSLMASHTCTWYDTSDGGTRIPGTRTSRTRTQYLSTEYQLCERVVYLLSSVYLFYIYRYVCVPVIYAVKACTAAAVDYVYSFFYGRTHHVVINSYQRDAHKKYCRACIMF